MGSGIAQVCAQAGYEVILNDMKIEFAERGKNRISENLSRQVSKERITSEEMEQTLSRISFLQSSKCKRSRFGH